MRTFAFYLKEKKWLITEACLTIKKNTVSWILRGFLKNAYLAIHLVVSLKMLR